MVLFWVLLHGLDLMDGYVLCRSILRAPWTLLCRLVDSADNVMWVVVAVVIVVVAVVVIVNVFLVRFTCATLVPN